MYAFTVHELPPLPTASAAPTTVHAGPAPTTLSIFTCILDSPHPNILSEPQLNRLGFTALLPACQPTLICPNGTRIHVDRAPGDNRPSIRAQIIHTDGHPPAIGLGFPPGAGTPVTFYIDTCAAASAADKGLAHLLLDRTGPRDLSVVGNLAVRALDSGTLPLLICPPSNNDLAAHAAHTPCTANTLAVPPPTDGSDPPIRIGGLWRHDYGIAPGLTPTPSINVDDSANDNYDLPSSHRRRDAHRTQPDAISSHPLPLHSKDVDDASPPPKSIHIITHDPLTELWMYAASLSDCDDSDDDTCDTTDPVHRRDASSSTMEALPDPTVVALPRFDHINDLEPVPRPHNPIHIPSLRHTATINESVYPTHDGSLTLDTVEDSDSDVWSDDLSHLPPDGDSDSQPSVPVGDDEVVLSEYGRLPLRHFNVGIGTCPSCKPLLSLPDHDVDLQPQLAALLCIDLTLAPPPPAAQTDTKRASPCTDSANADPDIPISRRPLCVRDLAVHLMHRQLGRVPLPDTNRHAHAASPWRGPFPGAQICSAPRSLLQATHWPALPPPPRRCPRPATRRNVIFSKPDMAGDTQIPLHSFFFNYPTSSSLGTFNALIFSISQRPGEAKGNSARYYVLRVVGTRPCPIPPSFLYYRPSAAKS